MSEKAAEFTPAAVGAEKLHRMYLQPTVERSCSNIAGTSLFYSLFLYDFISRQIQLFAQPLPLQYSQSSKQTALFAGPAQLLETRIQLPSSTNPPPHSRLTTQINLTSLTPPSTLTLLLRQNGR